MAVATLWRVTVLYRVVVEVVVPLCARAIRGSRATATIEEICILTGCDLVICD